jgi:hypothetical protein
VRLLFIALLAGGCSDRPLALGLPGGASPAFDLGGHGTDLGGHHGAADLAMVCAPGDAFIDGTTPAGNFRGRYAWSWYEGGDCAERPHLRVREDMNYDRGGQYLDVVFPDHAQIGAQAVMVQFVVGTATTLFADGSADLTVAEPLASTATIRLDGMLTVSGNGFQLSGSFSAPHCPLLDQICV